MSPAIQPTRAAGTDTISIHRKAKTAHFTQLSNALLRNPNLTFKARGILCHLLSHEAGWMIRMSELIGNAKNGQDGEESVRSGVTELIAKGYMIRERVHGDGGRIIGWRYEVFEEPITTSGFSTSGFSRSGFSTSGKSSPKNTKDKNTILKEEEGLLRKPSAPDGCDSPADTGIDPEELAQYRGDEPSAAAPVVEREPMLLASEDDDPAGKTFPWRQIMGAMARITPQMGLPTKGERRDAAMKNFWRARGKTIGSFEVLAEKVQASDFLMGRNGHTGRDGKPYSWSWIFSKDSKGRIRADRVMEDAYSNEAMAFVLEKQATEKLTKVMLSHSTTPIAVNLSEIWQGEPRYRVTGVHSNGCQEVIDYKD